MDWLSWGSGLGIIFTKKLTLEQIEDGQGSKTDDQKVEYIHY